MSLKAPSPVIIGGASRNGKTLLAQQIGQVSAQYTEIPFELLLNVYTPLAASARSPQAHAAIVRQYLAHRRATTADRSESLAPEDFLTPQQQKELIQQKTKKDAPTVAFFRIFETIARQSGPKLGPEPELESGPEFGPELESESKLGAGTENWVGADLHAECYYQTLRQICPDLRLILARRDPVEAICARLYWRSFPERCVDAEKETAYSQDIWNLSAQIGAGLAQKYPKDVLLLDMSSLWRGAPETQEKLADFIKLPSEEKQQLADIFSGFTPWFSLNKEGLFLCPDGQWRPLLSLKEQQTIRHHCPLAEEEGHAAKRAVWHRLIQHKPDLALEMTIFRHLPQKALNKRLHKWRQALKYKLIH